jgi:hypothetical protein
VNDTGSWEPLVFLCQDYLNKNVDIKFSMHDKCTDSLINVRM